jgi:hypothetical protein
MARKPGGLHLPARTINPTAHWPDLTTQAEVLRQGPSNLYRFYDADRRPLYIGESGHLAVRWYAHQTKAPWWPHIRYVALSFYGPRDHWEPDVEMAAIQAERPPFNTVGNRRSSRRVDPRLAPPAPEFPWL